ncbi:MAG: M1 family metallopeptidase [Myxococcales bacterium]
MLLAWLAPARAEDATDGQRSPVAQRYELDATLVPERHQVRGSALIEFTNTSASAVDELVFHLYLNAFRDRESVFMRESGGSMRGQHFTGRGSIELSSLSVDGKELLARARQELVKGDFTQLALPLEKPIAPGGKVVIESSFVSTLPEVFARSGYAHDFFCVAQWFPKLAKLEPNGTFTSFPYHALAEFYADFADYEVTLRAPRELVVAANGKLIRESKGQQQTARTFAIARAIDAVWVAGQSLEVQEEQWREVAVKYVYAPGYELALDEHIEMVRAGLDHFGRRFGAYPYPTLTVVVPPRRARGAAGMEYPGLFLTDGSWLPAPGTPGASGAFVTAHELAHQWFPMVLASNEMRYPVLDEGFAEWAALDLLRKHFGEVGAFSSWLPFPRFEVERVGTFTFDHAIAPGLSAPAYTPSEYGASVYGEAALALETIRRVFGRARFEEAMRRYAQDNWFGHPTPVDLATAFDRVYGPGFSTRFLLPLLIAGERVSLRIVQARTLSRGKGFVTEVRARRAGNVPLPSWLAAYDAQGNELTRVLFPEHLNALNATLETKAPVARVVLDPDRAVLVDASVRDQVVSFAPPRRSSWIGRAVASAQMLLSWFGP